MHGTLDVPQASTLTRRCAQIVTVKPYLSLTLMLLGLKLRITLRKETNKFWFEVTVIGPICLGVHSYMSEGTQLLYASIHGYTKREYIACELDHLFVLRQMYVITYMYKYACLCVWVYLLYIAIRNHSNNTMSLLVHNRILCGVKVNLSHPGLGYTCN